MGNIEINVHIKTGAEGIPHILDALLRLYERRGAEDTIPEVRVTADAPAAPGMPAALAAQHPVPEKAWATEEPQAAQAAPAPAPIPTPARKPVTAAQAQAAAGAFMDAAPGNLAVLQGIMRDLGVKALPELKTPEQLEAFADKLRGHGVTL